MYFFGSSTWCLFFYATELGLRVSSLASDVFFWFFDLRLLFLFYCAWLKGVGLGFWCIFCFLILGLLFYVTVLGLRLSGLGSDVFFLFFDLRVLFLCYSAWFKGVGFRFWCIFFWFFDLRLLILCYCGRIKGVGFRFWSIILVFRPEASFCMLLRVV